MDLKHYNLLELGWTDWSSILQVYLCYPLSLITGGTTAKIMVAAKDNFLGKFIYKDTIARNLAAVIYRDEKEIQTTAFKRYHVLQSATAFRHGYKLVLPKQEELKNVLDKVKDFFDDAKESFGKMTALTSTSNGESGEKSKVKGLQGRVVLPVLGKLSCLSLIFTYQRSTF